MSKPPDLGPAERGKILSGLLTDGDQQAPPFAEAELGALLTHQLRAGVAAELGDALAGAPETLAQVAAALARERITSFRELFAHPAPPPLVIEQVRRFAKHLMARDAETFPADLARVLFALSLLSAHPDLGTPGDAARAASLGRWCLAQSWLDEGAPAPIFLDTNLGLNRV